MSFDQAMAFVFPAEGGLSNVKGDRGGLTKYGITQRTFNAYNTRHAIPLASAVDLTPEIAKQIYKENYWDPACCGAMPNKIGIALADWSINHGVHGAVSMLQKCAGIALANCDGVAGKQTVQAVNNANEATLLDAYLQARTDWYETDVSNNPSQEEFLKGWLNRVEQLRTYLNSLT